MAKGTDETTKKYWQEMLVDMQIKIKGQNITLENNDIQALNAKTNIAIGTLNGYFGLDKSKMPANYPNADTRNLLAQYLGFVDWNEYVKSKKIETVETETVEPEIIWTMENWETLQKELENFVNSSNYRDFFKMVEKLPLTSSAKQSISQRKLEFDKGTFMTNPFFQQQIQIWIDSLKK